MAETTPSDGDRTNFAKVRMQNIGPISEGDFLVKPLTLFTGRNGAGKTITTTLLYILQKCIWNALRANTRSWSSQLLTIYRTTPKAQVHQAQNEELNSLTKGQALQREINSAFTEELSRAFADQKNIIRHGKKKAHFAIEHSDGWGFECSISSKTVMTTLSMPDIVFTQDKERPMTSMAIQVGITRAFKKAFAGWQDRPIMIPAGRAGITDSYRYLAEQILLERHGYRQGGPSGITRDFLALLVGSSQPANFFDDGEDENLVYVSSIFDPLLEGRLRPSADPEELFSFDMNGHKIDRNVMSSMVKELGPMVVLLQQSQSQGSVLMVDEPECHLHPRAQIELARAFVSLVANQSRFILSTHSPYLAQSLSNTWVEKSRTKEVHPEDMAVVNFSGSNRGVSIANVPFHSEYGFVFEEFTDTANEVQEEFVELFN